MKLKWIFIVVEAAFLLPMPLVGWTKEETRVTTPQEAIRRLGASPSLCTDVLNRIRVRNPRSSVSDNDRQLDFHLQPDRLETSFDLSTTKNILPPNHEFAGRIRAGSEDLAVIFLKNTDTNEVFPFAWNIKENTYRKLDVSDILEYDSRIPWKHITFRISGNLIIGLREINHEASGYESRNTEQRVYVWSKDGSPQIVRGQNVIAFATHPETGEFAIGILNKAIIFKPNEEGWDAEVYTVGEKHPRVFPMEVATNFNDLYNTILFSKDERIHVDELLDIHFLDDELRVASSSQHRDGRRVRIESWTRNRTEKDLQTPQSRNLFTRLKELTQMVGIGRPDTFESFPVASNIVTQYQTGTLHVDQFSNLENRSVFLRNGLFWKNYFVVYGRAFIEGSKFDRTGDSKKPNRKIIDTTWVLNISDIQNPRFDTSVPSRLRTGLGVSKVHLPPMEAWPLKGLWHLGKGGLLRQVHNLNLPSEAMGDTLVTLDGGQYHIPGAVSYDLSSDGRYLAVIKLGPPEEDVRFGNRKYPKLAELVIVDIFTGEHLTKSIQLYRNERVDPRIGAGIYDPGELPNVFVPMTYLYVHAMNNGRFALDLGDPGVLELVDVHQKHGLQFDDEAINVIKNRLKVLITHYEKHYQKLLNLKNKGEEPGQIQEPEGSQVYVSYPREELNSLFDELDRIQDLVFRVVKRLKIDRRYKMYDRLVEILANAIDNGASKWVRPVDSDNPQIYEEPEDLLEGG